MVFLLFLFYKGHQPPESIYALPGRILDRTAKPSYKIYESKISTEQKAP